MTKITQKPSSTEANVQASAAERAPIVLTPDQIVSIAGGLKPTGGRTTTGYAPPRNLGK